MEPIMPSVIQRASRLPATGRSSPVAGVASPKVVLVKPNRNASGLERLSDAPSSLRILGRVAEEHGSGWRTHVALVIEGFCTAPIRASPSLPSHRSLVRPSDTTPALTDSRSDQSAI